LKLVERIRKNIPDVGLTTDIIVGFPGESSEDYRQTRELVEEAQFDSVFIFKYSPREGTSAAELPDNVPEQEKLDRLQEINTIQKQITLKRNKAMISRTIEILVEGRSKKSAQDAMGRTQSNKIVVFPNTTYNAGDLVQVDIINAAGATLFGQPLFKL